MLGEDTQLVGSAGEGLLEDDENGNWYFATEGFTRLWRTDGTIDGTEIINDDYTRGSLPYNWVEFQNELYFVANGGRIHSADGAELYRSDIYQVELLAATGTQLFAWDSEVGTIFTVDLSDGTFDIIVDSGVISDSSFDPLFFATDTLLYFSRREIGTGETELWRSDGTESGTFALGTPNILDFRQQALFGDELFFQTEGAELWKTDGTVEGTQFVASTNLIYQYQQVGDLLFATTQYDLLVTDGTVAGTNVVQSFLSLNFGSYGGRLRMAAYNGEVYFTAAEDGLDFELWKSDGTTAGTTKVADVAPGFSGSFPSWIVADEDGLYFAADDQTHGLELWFTDGTADGTRMVKDINPGSGDSDPVQLTIADGVVFFGATNGQSGFELWQTNGNPDRTAWVRDIDPKDDPTLSGVVRELYPFEDKLYLSAHDGIHGYEPWVATPRQVFTGDFDGNGYDCGDIDAFMEEIANGTNHPSFDLNGDGLVDLLDRDVWLLEAGEAQLGPGVSYQIGDANLDGVVDGLDFIVWNGNKFTETTGWCSGDFTGDGVVDGLDYIAWNDNKFTSASRTDSDPTAKHEPIERPPTENRFSAVERAIHVVEKLGRPRSVRRAVPLGAETGLEH